MPAGACRRAAVHWSRSGTLRQRLKPAFDGSTVTATESPIESVYFIFNASLTMSEQPIPESRTYRHVKCGNETVVGGQPFEVVSNPMSSMEQTQCSACEAMFPISEFEWVDTKESIADYYTRHTSNATDTQRFLCSKKFMVGLIAAFALLTTMGIHFLVADSSLLTRAICILGGLMIGAMIGMAVFVSGFADPIKRKVCGVADTRLLT